MGPSVPTVQQTPTVDVFVNPGSPSYKEKGNCVFTNLGFKTGGRNSDPGSSPTWEESDSKADTEGLLFFPACLLAPPSDGHLFFPACLLAPPSERLLFFPACIVVPSVLCEHCFTP